MHQRRNKKLTVTTAAFLSSPQVGWGAAKGWGEGQGLGTQLLKQGCLDV